VVRVSTLQSGDLGLSLLLDYKRTLKIDIHTFPAFHSAHKTAKSLVVSLSMALNRMPLTLMSKTDDSLTRRRLLCCLLAEVA